jgi:hypothetical protein
MRITDRDARSYGKKEFLKVLEQHEKEKKDKYLQNCLEMWKDFTPMVYSVDGIAGCEAQNAKKRLDVHLADKWNREYSQMVFYVRVRMAIAVVRAHNLLIRGSRDQQRPRCPLIPNGATLDGW